MGFPDTRAIHWLRHCFFRHWWAGDSNRGEDYERDQYYSVPCFDQRGADLQGTVSHVSCVPRVSLCLEAANLCAARCVEEDLSIDPAVVPRYGRVRFRRDDGRVR